MISRIWEWPKVTGKKMWTSVLQPQGNEFSQQAEMVKLPQQSLWWDSQASWSLNFSLVRPWSCEPSSASHTHTADLLEVYDTKHYVVFSQWICHTAVEKECIQGSGDFTCLWHSAAQQVPIPNQATEGSQDDDSPRANTHCVRRSHFFMIFSSVLRGKLQCQIPCENHRHTRT